jgi:hypothetical protein
MNYPRFYHSVGGDLSPVSQHNTDSEPHPETGELLDKAANKLREIINIPWGWDGDCGATKLADDALDCLISIRSDALISSVSTETVATKQRELEAVTAQRDKLLEALRRLVQAPGYSHSTENHQASEAGRKVIKEVETYDTTN